MVSNQLTLFLEDALIIVARPVMKLGVYLRARFAVILMDATQ